MALLAIGFALFALRHLVPVEAYPPRFLFSGIPAALIVGGAVALDLGGTPLRNRLAKMLGDASYSLYLSHMFVIRLLRVLWNAAGIAVSAWLFVAAALVGACAAALLLAQLFELPLHRYLKSRINARYDMRGRPAVEGI